jgi:uncharacterized protein (TIGR03083 family)
MVNVSDTVLFNRSANSFIAVLAQVTDEQWELPGLGDWTVRSLAGHTARAILTVETYLGQEEPGGVTVPSAEEYYTSVYPQFTDAAAVAARGVEAGIWLGADPVGQVTDALSRTRALIESQPPTRIVSIGGMGILLSEYLRTRVFELVVHTIDLSSAIGVDPDLSPEAVADTVALASATAAARGRGVDVLMALTGRGTLPQGFSVV